MAEVKKTDPAKPDAIVSLTLTKQLEGTPPTRAYIVGSPIGGDFGMCMSIERAQGGWVIKSAKKKWLIVCEGAAEYA